ncbi:MAG TPA: cellulase family glycosylhydrolase [Pilimelia sp.]|nr:cellulase family glycosylhydrolase [Pilimelia sp.]
MRLRRAGSILSLSIVSALAATLLCAPSPASAGAGNAAGIAGHRSLQAYADAMQPGWNLGNTFDATGADETSWGNPRVTQELLRQIRAQGYRSLRLPVTWGQRMGAAPDYTIDPAFLARVEEVVDWALDAGLYVMLNMHHDTGEWIRRMGTEHDAVLARYRAAWTQIAAHFSGKSHRLSFEAVNEPRFSDDWNLDTPEFFTMLGELNRAFHGIVRSSGGRNADRPVVLTTLTGSSAQPRMDHLYEQITALDDDRIIATIHYYGYYPFSVNVAGGTRFDAAAQADLVSAFDRARATFEARGIPVIVGEYGLLGFDKHTGTIEQGEKLKFFEFFTYYARTTGLTTMLWDNGQHFDRVAHQWRDADLYQVMRAGWRRGRSSTAESDLLFVRRGQPAADRTVTLQLNGNRLVALTAGDRRLRPGRDYVLSGDQLTLRARLLASLTASGAYGVNAVLTARFSHGIAWTFNVITYDRPALSDATGTTAAFAVPTAFNGDRLATMRATYPDGTNAGPAGWTAFKEFGQSFAPSPETNAIRLLPAFFAEVTDGATVNLEFHFWSGEVVRYAVTRTGTQVTGVAVPA